MRWGYTNLSLMMWIGLTLYVIILGAFFKLISSGKEKKKAFNLAAVGLVFVHIILLTGLGLNDSAASLKKISFEAWVCGKQIQIADNSPAGRIFRDGGYFADKKLNLNSDDTQIRLGVELKKAGLEYSNSVVTVPIADDFELKIAGDSNLDWLRGALKYPSDSNEPSLVLENEKLVCPSGSAGVWNVFLARVDNDRKTYTWQKISLVELETTLAKAEDGDNLTDCLVMDFDIAKDTPEYRCADILKNDSKRCPEIDKARCLYKEVKT